MLEQRQQQRAMTELGLSAAPRRLGGGILSASFTILAVGAAGVVGAAGLGGVRPMAVLERMTASAPLPAATEPAQPPLSPPLSPARADGAVQRPAALLPALPLPLPRQATGAVPAAKPPSTGQGLIAQGDRLKVSFFETVAVSLGETTGSGSSTQATIFPRMDLSGEYVVDEAGGLDIPRLGWHAATGQGIGSLEALLAKAFAAAFERPGTVHVAVVDRRPVYVLGGPRGGTTIRHAPGLIVLQALAEAGGRQAPDTSRFIEVIRETQRLGEVQDRLARALVRQARLMAMRNGDQSIALSPAATALLAEALPQDRTDVLRDAADTLARDRQARAERLALATRQVDIAALELAAQNQRATQARVLADGRTRRLRGMEDVAARGNISQFKLADTGLEVAEAVAKQDDLRATVAQAQSRLTEAEIERVKFEQVWASQLALDIAAVAQEIADLRRAVVAIRAVLLLLDESAGAGRESGPGVQPGTRRPGPSILRRVEGGTVVLPASDTTPLLPGDVLQIDPRREDAAPGALAPQPSHLEKPS